MNITKKIVASIIGLSMVMMMVPGVAQGATIEELQVKIEKLLAEIADLRAKIAAVPAVGVPAVGIPAACTGITFVANLTIGSRGNDVKCLQALLNTDAATQVAATGAGSPGNETIHFGPLTRAAVVKFQTKNAISPAAGFVGPITRAKLNALLVAPVTPPVTPPEVTPPVTPPEVTPPVPPVTPPEVVVPTEGILTVEINPTPASGVRVHEGDTNVAVLGILARAKLSDITLQRIALNFGPNRIYDYLNYLSLYDGDRAVVGTVLNATTVHRVGGNYHLRLTGLNVKVPKDGSKVLTVRVSAVPALAAWLGPAPFRPTITVDANGVRGVDTAGIFQFGPTTAFFPREFTVDSTLAAQASLTLSRNADSPGHRNVAAGTLGVARGVELLRFNIKAEHDTVRITDIRDVRIAVTGAATSGVAYLYDGARLVNSSVVTGGRANFTDINMTVARDTTRTLTIKADFSAVSPTLSTSIATVDATTTVGARTINNIVAENSLGRTLGVGRITGTTSSDIVHIYTVAPILALTSATISRTPASPVASSTADATIRFTMTAGGGNVTLAPTGAITASYTTTAAGATTIGTALTYTVEGAVLIAGTHTIARGTTATITVNVNVNAHTLPRGYHGSFGHVTLTGITWGGDRITETTRWIADIYRTGNVLLP